MSYVRHYIMTATAERADDLSDALGALEASLRGFPGCLGIELLRDIDQPEKFYFIEYWDTKENHKAAGPLLPQDVMKRLGATLAGAPASASLNRLSQKAP